MGNTLRELSHIVSINIELLGKGINAMDFSSSSIALFTSSGSMDVSFLCNRQLWINVGTTITGFVSLMAASHLPWVAGQNRQCSAFSSSLTSSSSLSGYQEHHLLDLYDDPWRWLLTSFSPRMHEPLETVIFERTVLNNRNREMVEN